MSEIHVPIENLLIPPCREACPAGVDVARYIRAVRDHQFDEAVAVLRERLPLPVVCADACFAPCEDVCAYRQFGNPIAIRALKRAAVDRGGETWKKRRKPAAKTGKRVAIVGAGPAGLTAGYYLVGKGHEVTVFDAFPKPGGMLRYGIPNYRLPEARLDKDVNDILECGVKFSGNTIVGRDITLKELKKEFDAIFVASGANGSVKIPLDGAHKEGVFWGWEFLRDVGLGVQFDFSGDLIVVGGGNVAVDVALTARRMGAKSVHIFCLEKREEMPAHQWEIARAEEEGILIYNAWAPRKVLGDGKVSGLRFKRCTSVFDSTGNFSPTYDEEITYKKEARQIVLAVGQAADLGFVEEEEDIRTDGGRIEVKEGDMATGQKGVFAGGDVVSGPDSIISAIGHGRRAAASIDRYLGGSGDIEEVLAVPEKEVVISQWETEVGPRNDMPLLKPWERISGFDQVELGLTDRQVEAESNRCLNCDARRFEVFLNTESCKECGYCVEVCGVGTFGAADVFNAKGYRPREVKSSERCVGCFKCYFACPDFAIDVIEATG